MKELIYPSTYHAMKAGPCRVGVCKHDGECELCEEYGLLRRYAARDVDRIHELRALVGEMADEKRISDAVIKSLRDKKLEKDRDVAEKDNEIARLRAALKPVLDCKVMGAVTAEIEPGKSEYCAAIIEKAQRIYYEG